MTKFIALILVTFFMHAGFASETMKGAKKDLETFKQGMSAELEKIEANLKAMSKKAEKKSDAAYKNTVKELSIKRDKIKIELHNLKSDTEDQWKKAKSGLSSSLDSLNERIQKALKD